MWYPLGPGWLPAVEESGLILVLDQQAFLEHGTRNMDDSYNFSGAMKA